MIIKIITDICGAVYYDELEKVRYEMVNYAKFESSGFDALWITDDLKTNYEKAKSENLPLPNVCVIIGRRRKINNFTSEEELGIATNMRSYLLNDEGRTIERIN